jgi:predicted small secreted protein
MRKSLTTIGALLLVAGLAACNRGAGNGSDEERLNQAARTLDDNGVYDTSADDAALNQAELPANEAASANGAAANTVAPGNTTGNRQ